MSQARHDDNGDDALVDAHVHVVPPGLPGLHTFPAVLDGAVATVAAAVRADMAASGTVQALAMGVLSDDPDDPLGVAATRRIADQVPGLHAIGVADPRRNDPEHLDRVEHQLQQGRIKGLKAYLGLPSQSWNWLGTVRRRPVRGGIG